MMEYWVSKDIHMSVSKFIRDGITIDDIINKLEKQNYVCKCKRANVNPSSNIVISIFPSCNSIVSTIVNDIEKKLKQLK